MISTKRRLFSRILQRAIEQRFGVAANGGERRAQFVRDVGDEILAHALQTLQFGDVVQDGEGAPGGGPPKGPASTSKEWAPAAGKVSRCSTRSPVARTRVMMSRKPGSRTNSSQAESRESREDARPRLGRTNELQKVTRRSLSTARTPSTMLARIASRRAPSSFRLSTNSRIRGAVR